MFKSRLTDLKQVRGLNMMSKKEHKTECMCCKDCGSRDLVFMAKISDTQNEYVCIGCQRTVVTDAINENKEITV